MLTSGLRSVVSLPILLVGLLAAITSQISWAAETNKPAQENLSENLPAGDRPVFRGSGDQLELRIQGQILTPDGQPAVGADLEVEFRQHPLSESLSVERNADRFEFWLPIAKVTGDSACSLQISASSADGQQLYWRTVQTYEFRQLGITGLEIPLKKKARSIEVVVTYKGEPVEGAQVVGLMGSAYVLKQTDAEGKAVYPTLAEDERVLFSVWSEAGLFGGTGLRRIDSGSPDKLQYDLELEPAGPMTVQVVNDEDNMPVADLDLGMTLIDQDKDELLALFGYYFQLNVGRVKTDQQGQATFPYVPKRLTVIPGVMPFSTHWGLVSQASDRLYDPTTWDFKLDPTYRDQPYQVRVKPTQPASDANYQISGQVVSAAGENVEGLLVEASAYHEGMNHYALTDAKGRFTLTGLGEHDNCVFVYDQRFSSNVVNLTAALVASPEPEPVQLELLLSQPVEVLVTQGSAKTPVANKVVDVSLHYIPEGSDEKNAVELRSFSQATNERGVVLVNAPSGSKVSASYFFGRVPLISGATIVQQDMPGQISLHRPFESLIRGQVVLPADSTQPLTEVFVRISPLNQKLSDDILHNYFENAYNQGKFEFEAYGDYAVYAATSDESLAGFKVFPITGLEANITLELHPTGKIEGTVLIGGQPATELLLGLYVLPFYDASIEDSFDSRFCQVDAKGNFMLENVPLNTPLLLELLSEDMHAVLHTQRLVLKEPEIQLEPIELQRSFVDGLAYQKFKHLVDRDYGVPVLVLAADAKHQALVDDVFDEDVIAKLSVLNLDTPQWQGADQRAFAELRWPKPEPNLIFIAAYGPDGVELARRSYQVTDDNRYIVLDELRDFVREQVPTEPEEDWESKSLLQSLHHVLEYLYP